MARRLPSTNPIEVRLESFHPATDIARWVWYRLPPSRMLSTKLSRNIN
jgi:hypothetical protein